jgi:hypothetical protein
MNLNSINGNLRRHWSIPKFDATSAPIDDGELLTVQKAAEILGVSPGTVHRWLLDGFIAGEQITSYQEETLEFLFSPGIMPCRFGG